MAVVRDLWPAFQIRGKAISGIFWRRHDCSAFALVLLVSRNGAETEPDWRLQPFEA
jgi:hypothetical protein